MIPEPVSTLEQLIHVLTRVAEQHKHASCDLHAHGRGYALCYRLKHHLLHTHQSMPQKLGTRYHTKLSRRGFLSNRSSTRWLHLYLALRLKLGPSRAAELYRSKPLVLQSTFCDDCQFQYVPRLLHQY
jgi:hypothetical protein